MQRGDSIHLKVTNKTGDSNSQMSRGRMSQASKNKEAFKPEAVYERELEACKTEFFDVRNEQKELKKIYEPNLPDFL